MLKLVSIIVGVVSICVFSSGLASAHSYHHSHHRSYHYAYHSHNRYHHYAYRTFHRSHYRSYYEYYHQANGQSYMKASFYSTGHRTASGEHFNPNGYTAASRTLPFGTRLQVTNPVNGRSVTVRVNDRGPFIRGRDLDLARGAAAALGMIGQGTANLKVARLN